jgi:hypothetical protein
VAAAAVTLVEAGAVAAGGVYAAKAVLWAATADQALFEHLHVLCACSSKLACLLEHSISKLVTSTAASHSDCQQTAAAAFLLVMQLFN